MKDSNNRFLTSNQITGFLLILSVGGGYLNVGYLVDISKQDAWISALLALIYPFYIILLSNYIIKKYPTTNILSLSLKYLGNGLGTFLNFVFALQWILYTADVVSDIINISRIYYVPFLTPFKVAIVAITLSFFSAYKGLETLGKISEINMYLIFIIIAFSVSALRYSTVLNIQPVLGSSLTDILKSSKIAVSVYPGLEALLILHPFAKETTDVKKASFKALFINGFIWVWVVFISIFYLGIDIIPKSYRPYALVFESIHLPIINNFRYIFMFILTTSLFRTTANDCFLSYFILNQITKIEIKKLLFILYPFTLILSLQFVNVNLLIDLLTYICPAFVIFNIAYISLIAFMIFLNYKRPAY